MADVLKALRVTDAAIDREMLEMADVGFGPTANRTAACSAR